MPSKTYFLLAVASFLILSHLMSVIVGYLIQLKGHWESNNEIGFQSPVEQIAGIQTWVLLILNLMHFTALLFSSNNTFCFGKNLLKACFSNSVYNKAMGRISKRK